MLLKVPEGFQRKKFSSCPETRLLPSIKKYGLILIFKFSARQIVLCCNFYLLKILKNTHHEASKDKFAQGNEFLKKVRIFWNTLLLPYYPMYQQQLASRLGGLNQLSPAPLGLREIIPSSFINTNNTNVIIHIMLRHG